MIITIKKKKDYNPKWLYIPDHPYRILTKEVLDQEKQMHY